ncbi:MAG: DoxX family protein [Deltaproteobacteria bacterium]|nr:DoxX family protein [Deltaproteobacteria bacterium]
MDASCRQKLTATHTSWGILILRIVIGLIFIKAGGGKLFGWFGGPGIEGATGFFTKLGIPLPYFNAIFVGCVELIGGACLVLGFLIRVVSIPLAITMLVAILTAHRDGDFYYPLVILCSCLAFIETGAGCASLDSCTSSCKKDVMTKS